MNRLVTLLISVGTFVALAGCGADNERDRHGSTAKSVSRESSLVDRCTDGFMDRVDLKDFPDATPQSIRGYIEGTYCENFAKRGWVHPDGALKIEAHTEVLGFDPADQESESVCMEADAAGGKTVPCEEQDADEPTILDCAILHRVRKSEVASYLETLRKRHRHIECDDDTRLDSLGVPMSMSATAPGQRIGARVQAAMVRDGQDSLEGVTDGGVLIGSRRGDCVVVDPARVRSDVRAVITDMDDTEIDNLKLEAADILTAACRDSWYAMATWSSNRHNVIQLFNRESGSEWEVTEPTQPPPCVTPPQVAELWELELSGCPSK